MKGTEKNERHRENKISKKKASLEAILLLEWVLWIVSVVEVVQLVRLVLVDVSIVSHVPVHFFKLFLCWDLRTVEFG